MQKINLKWIKHLNVGLETIKLLEENIGKKLLDIGRGKDLLDMTPKAQAVKTKVDQWDCIMFKNFCMARKPSTK